MLTNQELLQMAKEASKNAYCVYSKFAVGACALYESGKTYVGCNVENSSYGLALCAERNAISTAVAMGEKTNLLKIAIYSPNGAKCFPCGACRQWMQEFSKIVNIEIILEDEDKSCCSYFLSDIFPHPFELI